MYKRVGVEKDSPNGSEDRYKIIRLFSRFRFIVRLNLSNPKTTVKMGFTENVFRKKKRLNVFFFP